MKNKPETWAYAKQLFFEGDHDDALETRIDRELEETFPASDPPGGVLGVDRGCGYLLPHIIKTI